MKIAHGLLLLLSCVIITQCSKEKNIGHLTRPDQNFSDSAIIFLQLNLSPQDYDNLDMGSIRVLKNGRQIVAFRIAEKGSNDQKFILLHKAINTFQGNKVEFSQLNIGSKKFDGRITLRDFKNSLLKVVTVKANKAVQSTDASERVISFQLTGQNNRVTDTIDAKTLDEVFVVGTGPIPAPDYASMYWLFNQYAAYENAYYNTYAVGSGTQSAIQDSVNQIAIAPKYVSPDHPIKSVIQELRCFSISSQNTYSVSVNVNEPYPATRELTNISADHQAGHTFITMKETHPDGTVLVRNIGFYPMSYAMPGSGVDKSVFGDDSDTPYAVSLAISMTANEFNTFRTAINSQQDKTYLLEGNNCVNSVLSAFGSINVALPSTIGNNALFSGNNPADLGEDIRGMDLSKFSAENGGRKLVRTVSNQNDIKATAKQGGC